MSPPASTTSLDEYWNVCGILVSRKLDPIAVLAFVLALGSILVQLHSFWKGAKLKLLPPDQVFIRKDASYSDQAPRAIFGATLIYVNSGDKGYNAIVRREALHVTIGSNDFEQGWDEFVTFDGYTPTKAVPAKPFSVDGAESVSHQTAFIPWPIRCTSASAKCDVEKNHMHWDQFISELKQVVRAGRHEFEFRFSSDVVDDSAPIVAACKIEIDAAIVDTIEQNAGYNPTCFE